jgi:hypothetical protein
MTSGELTDMAWLAHPFCYRNNRGCAYVNGKFIRYGIPAPNGKGESDDAMKGGDLIGYTETVITPDMVGKTIAVFTSIEVKTKTDRLKSGQIRWHEFILEHGGISEIWQENTDGTITIIKDTIE